MTAVNCVGGAAAGPYWDVAANWSNDAVPTATADVTINSGTPTTITIQSGDVEVVNSLTTAAGYNLAMTAGSLTIHSTSTTSVLAGNFNLSGGTLVVSDGLTERLGVAAQTRQQACKLNLWEHAFTHPSSVCRLS